MTTWPFLDHRPCLKFKAADMEPATAPNFLCMWLIHFGDFIFHALYLSQLCHSPSFLQELLQELKHLKIKVEELENERNQYEWELKATKVKGSLRHLRRLGRAGDSAGRGFTLSVLYSKTCGNAKPPHTVVPRLLKAGLMQKGFSSWERAWEAEVRAAEVWQPCLLPLATS